MITHGRLLQVMNYDAETGLFHWLAATSKKTKIGSQAKTINAYGYIRIRIDKEDYVAHRLAWFYVYGKWPENQIDHINGVRTDNRINNLRDVCVRQNQENQRRAQKGNRSGFLGVSWNNKDQKWWSRISVNGKFNYLGSYDKPEDAHAAYVEAKRLRHAGCTI